MAEATSNVRLVRCPKCGNLLPELHDFSVYQCGGCGTVLRGKSKGDGLSDASDGEKARAVSDKGEVAMNSDTVSDFDEESSEFQPGRTKGKSRFKRENFYDDDECSTSKGNMDPGVRMYNYRGKINTVESVGLSVANELKGVPMDSRYMERSYANGAEGKFGTSLYSNDGPLDNDMGSYYGSRNHRRYNGGFDGVARVADLENNRAELLRKINELKDQLNRTDVSEKPKDHIPVDGRIASTTLDIYSRRPLGPTKNVRESPYIYGHQRDPPYNGTHGPVMQDYYPSNNFSDEFPGYGKAYRQEMLGRPPRQTPYQHFPRHHMDNFFTPHPHETLFHQSACSCSHCLNQNYHIPSMIQRRSRNNPTLHHHMNAGYGPGGYMSEGGSYPLNKNYLEGRRLTRSPSDLESENINLGHHGRYPRRAVVTHRVEHVYQAIAGGAPFITCCNCFELLKLPKKLMITGKSEKRMRCGACSSVILFELGSKGLGASVPTRVRQVSAELAPSPGDVPNENLQNDAAAIPWSEDYDNSKYDYHFADTKLESPSRSQKSHSTKSEKMRISHSSSSSLSEDAEDEPSPDSVIDKHDISQKDHAYNISPEDVVEKYEENVKEHADQEKGVLDRSTSRQSSVKDVATAVEVIDVSVSEFVNSTVSVESNKSNRVQNLLKTNKGGNDSFMGFIKRSLGARSSQSVDIGRSNAEIGSSNVFVNGRYIPDRVVRKAEKLAGSIQPGYYWYDYQAGFWGVMGHPCLGVIMPNIEEFNYPIPRDCAAGNTGVYVNGRELHQKDLDLLASRGLPVTENKSYSIDISGKVIDDNTGEELDGLGKLAPTVERVKHGFGMKVPKALAEQLC